MELAKARQQTESELLEAKAAAEARAQKIQAQAVVDKARADAEAITLLAEANYNKSMKEHEAASQIPEQQLRRDMLKAHIEMACALGSAAWRHPDVFQNLVDNFKGELRLGSTTIGELLSNAVKKGASDA